MCMCVCVFDGGLSIFVFGWRVCVWWFGGEINGGGGVGIGSGFFLFIFDIASMLCTWFFMKLL